MRIAVLSETDPVETRVAATPETVKKYKSLGADVVVQAGAGTQRRHSGRRVRGRRRDDRPDARRRSRTPTSSSRCAARPTASSKAVKPGALVIGIMDPYGQDAALKRWPRRRPPSRWS